ncbi:MAG: hypothetical protein SCK70_11600 [bacterium]|nr:hypothetical protein [bacterium]
MSGIDLLLRTAIGYERTHQLAIFTLLSKSSFASFLIGVNNVQSVLWEPERQLFDLGLQDISKTIYLEIKMWSSLTDSQQKRQHDFLSNKQCSCFYLLLGTSWFEHSAASIVSKSYGVASKIGYDELISALNKLMVASGQSPDVYELALAYRNAIQEQFDKLKNAFKNPDGGRIYFYSLYREIQKSVSGMETKIYTVNNRGGPVYILNNVDYWMSFSKKNLSGELFYEIVNGRLCIKFYSEAEKADKYTIRDRIRHAVRKVLGTKYPVVDSGRIGAYMTACQIDYDFCDIEKIDESASLFQDVAKEFSNIIKEI